jgi:hypothetical protein
MDGFARHQAIRILVFWTCTGGRRLEYRTNQTSCPTQVT